MTDVFVADPDTHPVSQPLKHPEPGSVGRIDLVSVAVRGDSEEGHLVILAMIVAVLKLFS